ncbi:MAG: RsmF rRNA methyltransferase first C-terminal domain-containing protein [Eubacterium sp.]|nr:RsmF rRNA methyltransferase first C-terminal domain-containing protein [Eubacterium sp.]
MLPQKFSDRMQQMLGDEYEAFRAAFAQERYQALRLNALKTGWNGRNAAEADLAGFLHLSPVPWAENGYYYEAADQPGKHPYHAVGVYYIQEPSAMAPAELLDVQPGESVLDLCAAPGGKSAQIAAKLGGKGFLLCNEINGARAKILSENVERMGIVNAYVTNETPARLAEFFPAYFDKVLVDAPCSGEGMFRKNEAACEEWSPENVLMCAARQDEILDCAAGMLRPGGKLVYSTCTFAPEENEGSVSRFLERHGEFSLLPIEKEKLGLAGCDGSADYLRESVMRYGGSDPQDKAFRLEYTLRLWPHKVKGEGHFAALFQKAGDLPEEYRDSIANRFVTGVSDRELGEYFQFCQETFGRKELPVRQDRQPVYIRFGDNLYLTSPQMPSVKGLKVLRPGLHLGILKKDRFEPSHALALALSPGEVRNVWNLDCEEGRDAEKGTGSERNMAAAYLNGQTFPAEGGKGWYLICVDGFSMGWGKLAGGIMKNHYPKGLRGKV